MGYFPILAPVFIVSGMCKYPMESIKINFQRGFYPKTKNGTNPKPNFVVSIDARVFHQPITLDNREISTVLPIK
ncbi:MAG TPA: hypothetical protein DCP32_07470 [Anaerolineaceae bacterium]|nr:MAG: hypothetical protein A2X24_10210 [Chloroflexi bacterium GWB2_54_36]HAL16578.1 hypothetical protein [Anaerolineaceae bacterium]HBA92787.1 hypothetical protein [Anaerolineaceae bacterium]